MDVWCVCAFFCVCVVVCLGRGLATSWSPVQGVLPYVNDQETEKSGLCSKSGSKEEEKMFNSSLCHRTLLYRDSYKKCYIFSSGEETPDSSDSWSYVGGHIVWGYYHLKYVP
jgi:hypothetical protein